MDGKKETPKRKKGTSCLPKWARSSLGKTASTGGQRCPKGERWIGGIVVVKI